MDSLDEAINKRITEETLKDDACDFVFRARRNKLAADTDLPTDVREGGLRKLNLVIANDVPQAIRNGQPVVKILKREILAIGRLHHENTLRLLAEEEARVASESGAAAQTGDEVKEESDEMQGVKREQGEAGEDAGPASESSPAPQSEIEAKDGPDEIEGLDQRNDEDKEEEEEAFDHGDEQEADSRAATPEEILEEYQEEIFEVDETDQEENDGSEADFRENSEEDPEYGKAPGKGKGVVKSKAALKTKARPVGRPLKRDTDAQRAAAAMEAKRQRRFRTHHPRPNEVKPLVRTPRMYDVLDEDPRVRKHDASSPASTSLALTDEVQDAEEALSPTPIAPAKASRRQAAKPKSMPLVTDEDEEVGEPVPPAPAPLTPAAAARAARANRRASGITRSEPSIQATTKPPSSSSKEGVPDTAPKSLIVKLNIGKRLAPPPQPTGRPKRVQPAEKIYKVRSKGGRRVKSKETVDTDTEDDAEEDDAEPTVATKKRSGKIKSAEVVSADTEIEDSDAEEESDSEMLIRRSPPHRKAISSTNIPTPSARHNAIAETVVAPTLSANPTLSTTPDSVAERWESESVVSDTSVLSTPPETPAKLLRHTGTSSSPYPPFPTTESKMDIEPFHRGAIIALENVLEEHRLDPETDLLDIITDLNDTRPIVNDRVHKQIMAGGGWVYQILKDLAEEKEEDGEDEEVDVEGVCGELRGWVDGEFARVG